MSSSDRSVRRSDERRGATFRAHMKGEGMAGQMVHFEIPAGDTGKAKEFWGGLFGWEFQEYPGSPTEYHMTRFSETTGGAIYGEDTAARGTRTYFDVDDIKTGA